MNHSFVFDNKENYDETFGDVPDCLSALSGTVLCTALICSIKLVVTFVKLFAMNFVVLRCLNRHPSRISSNLLEISFHGFHFVKNASTISLSVNIPPFESLKYPPTIPAGDATVT